MNNLSDEPIFKTEFGTQWDILPPAMKRRYGVRPRMGDRVRMHGHLTISMAKAVRWISPLMRLTGLLIPVVGKFPTIVDFETYKDNPKSHLIRYVQTPNKTITFNSEWIKRGDEIIEILGGLCCWRAHYSWDGTHILIKHKGYGVKIGQHIFKLPLTWLFGRGDARETPLSENSFAMYMTITHPLWGELYRYEGEFTLESDHE